VISSSRRCSSAFVASSQSSADIFGPFRVTNYVRCISGTHGVERVNKSLPHCMYKRVVGHGNQKSVRAQKLEVEPISRGLVSGEYAVAERPAPVIATRPARTLRPEDASSSARNQRACYRPSTHSCGEATSNFVCDGRARNTWVWSPVSPRVRGSPSSGSATGSRSNPAPALGARKLSSWATSQIFATVPSRAAQRAE
jgi:hypothetical protein